MTPDQIDAAVDRGRVIWDEIFTDGQLPFVEIASDDPSVIVSAWRVADSGNEVDDFARGVCYAELLVQRAKNWRAGGTLAIDPYRIISEVLIAIAQNGSPGPIERGFFSRVAMLALAASQN